MLLAQGPLAARSTPVRSGTTGARRAREIAQAGCRRGGRMQRVAKSPCPLNGAS